MLKELKNKMKRSGNITLWNQNRRFAKKIYSSKIIGCLDSSGYINQVLKRPCTSLVKR